MKLQTKIHKGMLLLIAVTLLISYSIFTYIIYRQTMNMSIYEVHQEAQYIKRLLANTGSVFLPTIDAVLYDTRISLIDKAGNVLYDSNRDIDFENHLLRSEVQEALAGKIGEDIRTSETLGTKMYYYAEMVDNNILRIAKKFDAMWITALRILPVILAAACIMFILAYILAKILVNKIIVPVNQINLSNPLERKNYDEIMPLLVSIEKQNMEKEKIMCNKCGKELMMKNGILHEDGLFVTKEWGYFSGKDLQIHQFCLCESCYDEFTESFFIPVENQEKRAAMD